MKHGELTPRQKHLAEKKREEAREEQARDERLGQQWDNDEKMRRQRLRFLSEWEY